MNPLPEMTLNPACPSQVNETMFSAYTDYVSLEPTGIKMFVPDPPDTLSN